MTDKEILEAMRSMIEPINTRLDTMQADIKAINTRLDNVEENQQAIRASQLKVELEQYPRIAAALDGVVGGIEKNKTQDERITALENKAERHDNRILAVEYAIKAK